jgi:hypothetical protein
LLVAGGIAIWFAAQSFVNIGMTLGVAPVTGLPLPFVSYGGSAMFADMIAVGVLQIIRRRHPAFGLADERPHRNHPGLGEKRVIWTGRSGPPSGRSFPLHRRGAVTAR